MPKYVPVRVSTLRGDLKIPFNAFVRVAGKHILFCREGDSFEGTRLERLRSKKLLKMFIPEDQIPAYESYVRESLNRAYDSSLGKSIEVRTQVIHGALQAAGEDLMDEPSNETFYKVALDGIKKFKEFFLRERFALKAMLDIKNTDFSVGHHGAVVAALSLSIAEEMNFNESHPMQIDPLCVGCLIHDIEHNYNNINLSVPMEELSEPEKLIYDKHTKDGLLRIKNDEFYDPIVRSVILQHDEKIDGSGPNKIREKDLNMLIHIVTAANAFDQYLTYGDLSAKEALKKMLIEKMGVVSLDAMRALQSALKNRGAVS